MTTKQAVVALTLVLVLTVGLIEAAVAPVFHSSFHYSVQPPHSYQQQPPHSHQDQHDNDHQHQHHHEEPQHHEQPVGQPHLERTDALVQTHADTKVVSDSPQPASSQAFSPPRQPIFSAASNLQVPMPVMPTVFQLFRNPLWPFFRPASYRNYGYSAMPLQQAGMGFHYGTQAWPTFAGLSRAASLPGYDYDHMHANDRHNHPLPLEATPHHVAGPASQRQQPVAAPITVVQTPAIAEEIPARAATKSVQIHAQQVEERIRSATQAEEAVKQTDHV